MSAVDDFMSELASLLHVRGSARRRLLRECRDHLEESTAHVGPDEAVRRFGSASALAASIDTEASVRRTRFSTLATSAGVLAVGASTLALVTAADSEASAVVGWAVAFFAAAQTAAVCAVLGALQAATLRRAPATASDLALLCRRNSCALVFAGLAMFCAGGAVPGNASAVVLLAGPAVALLAGVGVLRARSLVRRLEPGRSRATRSPLEDLGELVHLSLPTLRPTALLAAAAVGAAGAAFVWDRAEQATASSALAASGIEVALVVAGFLLLGPVLGLRPGRARGQAWKLAR